MLRTLTLIALAMLACGAAPDTPRPSLCISSSIAGFSLDRGQWRSAAFSERRYILRLLTDEDYANFPIMPKDGQYPADFGLFAFGSGALVGWCHFYAPPGIQRKLMCTGYLGDLSIGVENGHFERFSRGGFVGGDGGEGAVSVEIGQCTRI